MPNPADWGRRALVFALITSWLWINLYWGEVDEHSVWLYALQVMPTLFYVLCNLKHLFSAGRLNVSGWFIAFGILASSASFVRGDTFFLAHSLLTCVIIVIVTHAYGESDYALTRKLLVRLFWISCLLSIIFYYAGLNEWGFLPGQSKLTLDQGGWYKVSLFPWFHIVASSQFALFVAIFLLFHRQNRSGADAIALCLACYFVLLSGVRTSQLGLFIVTIIWFYVRGSRVPSPTVLAVFPVVVLASVVVALSSSAVIATALDAIGLDQLTSFVLHINDDKSANVDDVTVTASIFRAALWIKHMQLMASSPLFGIGQFDLWNYIGSDPILAADIGLNHSESLLTYNLAQYGLIYSLFLIGLFYVIRVHIKTKNYLGYSSAIVLLIALLCHGTYFYPYHFLFFVWMSAFVICDRRHCGPVVSGNSSRSAFCT